MSVKRKHSIMRLVLSFLQRKLATLASYYQSNANMMSRHKKRKIKIRIRENKRFLALVSEYFES